MFRPAIEDSVAEGSPGHFHASFHIYRPIQHLQYHALMCCYCRDQGKIMNKRLLLLSADEVRRRLLRVGAVVPTLISDNANLFYLTGGHPLIEETGNMSVDLGMFQSVGFHAGNLFRRFDRIMRPDPVTDIEQVGIVFVATK